MTELRRICADPDSAELLATRLLAPCTRQAEACDQLVDLACGAGLDLTRTAALLMKYEDQRPPTSGRPGTTRPRSQIALLRALLRCEALAIPRREMALLVGELGLLDAQSLPLDSEILAAVATRHERTRQQLQAVGDADRERYLAALSGWIDQVRAHRRLVANKERIDRRARHLRQAFMEIFGDDYRTQRSEAARVQIARGQLESLQRFRDAGAEQADEFGAACPNRTANANENGLAFVDPYLVIAGDTARDTQTLRFRQARAVLRRIASLAHPDRVTHADLSFAQRARLESIWHRSTDARERNIDAAQLGAKLEFLRALLHEAEAVVHSPAAAVDPTLIVQGATLEEQMAWFHEAKNALDARIASLQGAIFGQRGDQELALMEALLNAPQQEQQRQQLAMRATALECSAEADELEARINELIDEDSRRGFDNEHINQAQR